LKDRYQYYKLILTVCKKFCECSKWVSYKKSP